MIKGRFPLGGIFRAEGNFLFFKDQPAESRRQKTNEIIISLGKSRLEENGPYDAQGSIIVHSLCT